MSLGRGLAAETARGFVDLHRHPRPNKSFTASLSIPITMVGWFIYPELQSLKPILGYCFYDFGGQPHLSREPSPKWHSEAWFPSLIEPA